MFEHPAEPHRLAALRGPWLPLRRALGLSLGCAWAAGLLLLAMGMWDQPGDFAQVLGAILGVGAAAVGPLLRTLATLAAAGAQFIFICLVADEICREAPLLLVVFLKTLTAGVAWGALLVAAWQVWHLEAF
jgi:hypothetical protein